MSKSTSNFLTRLFKSPAKKPALTKKRVSKSSPQWKELGKLTSRNVRGLFDTIESCVYMDTGDVIVLDTRIKNRTSNRKEIAAEIHQWATYRGLIRTGEVIAVR